MRVALILVVAMTRAAIADTLPIAQDPKSAQDLYAEGQTAYDRADYATAIDRWQVAYQISGASALLFNVAQAMRLSGDCARAIETYHLFLVADPDTASDQHRLADEFVRELRPTCPVTPPHSPTLPPTRSPPPVEISSERTVVIVDLATASVGVIAIGVGLALGHHGQSIGDEITATCAIGCDWTTQHARDASGRRDVDVGYALDGIGAAAIVGGAIAYFLEARHAHDTIVVAPNPSEGGARVSWVGSW